MELSNVRTQHVRVNLVQTLNIEYLGKCTPIIVKRRPYFHFYAFHTTLIRRDRFCPVLLLKILLRLNRYILRA